MAKTIAQLERELDAAQKRSLRFAERRHSLPIGSSRACVTTANANWARAAEYRDRCKEALEAAQAGLAARETA